jgi:predicted nucleic-acid-binding Zn-ribbon protein
MLRVIVIYCFNCGYTSIMRQRIQDIRFKAPTIL